MKLRPSTFAILISVLLGFASLLRAQDGLLGATPPNSRVARSSAVFEQQLAAADFDNDQKPDGALLLPAGMTGGERAFRIELHISAGENSAIVFSAAERSLSISARDVNHDGVPDIVIEKPFTGQKIRVYLNDGHGTFHKARSDLEGIFDPSAPELRGWFTRALPSSYLPSSRGFGLADLRAGRFVDLLDGPAFELRHEAAALPSGQHRSSHPRAPPSFLFL